MAALKYSRQRESIKNYLLSTNEHPSADIVYQHVREDFPNISLGTVYRNLKLLAELGEITRFSCGDGSEHFDYTTEPLHMLQTDPGSGSGHGRDYQAESIGRREL